MENRQGLKMENPIRSSLFLDHLSVDSSFSGLMNGSSFNDAAHDQKGSIGFMELLSIRDFCPTSASTLAFFATELQHLQASGFEVDSSMPTQPQLSESLKEPQTQSFHESPTSEILNTPATPNSPSMISLVSRDAPSVELADKAESSDHDELEEGSLQKIKKQLKPKKASQKKQREPKVAFMTKSEVDHLEDGYRWRKYGQKAVKNSPFPRSYYRCTNASCSVKKRVERSFADPSFVVTTYEGQHIHPSPTMPRPIASPLLGSHPPGASAFSLQPIPVDQYQHHPNLNIYQHDDPFHP